MADILDTPQAGPAAIRGGVIRVVGYGASVLLSVGSAALLFRHLGVEDSGRYVTVTSLVLVASGLVDLGLTGIGVRELAVREAGERSPLMRNLIGLRVVLSLVGVAGAVAFAAAVDYSDAMVLGTLLAGLGFAAAASQSTLVSVLTVELRLGLVTLLELLRQVVFVAAIVLLVLAGAELLPFLAASLPAGLVVLAATVAILAGSIAVKPAFDRAEWRLLLRDMLPYAAATALGAVYFRVSMVLLSLVSSAQQTGYFGASFRIIETLLAIPNLLVTAAFPIFARTAGSDRARLGYALQRMLEATVLAGGWVALMLIVGAPLIVEIIAGDSFAPSAEVLRIQAGALLLTFAGAPLGYALLSLRRHRDLLVITLAALVLNGVLVPLLADTHGANGAAAATLGAEFTLTASALFILARLDRRLRLSLAVVVKAAPGFGAGCAVLAVPGVPSVVRMALATLLYAGLGLLLRAVPDEILVEARSAIHSLRRRRAAS